MINKKISVLIVLFLILINSASISKDQSFIVYKVENEIITNTDIKRESKYLMALNNQLEKMSNKRILEIAAESIIKETIKKIEIIKYFELDQKNPYLEQVIKSFYLKLNLKNENEFSRYLTKYDLTIEEMKKKIEIETSWNQLIYERYNKQLDIDVNELKQRIKSKKLSVSTKKYLLSEIIFENIKDESFAARVKKINTSIDEIGFKNTSTIYSISDSSKFGGNIGWINAENLSDKLIKVISKLSPGNYTKPIQISSGYLILKLDDVKIEKIKIDEKKELEKIILYEQEKQLAQFSKIYFNKIRINTSIREL